METNSQGRKKHMVEGTVQKIARTDEVVREAREDLVNAADAGAKLKGAGRKKGFFAMNADIFRK